MRKKHRPRRVWVILSILAILLVTVTMQALAEMGRLPIRHNDGLEGRNSHTVSLPQSTGFGFDLTPVPSVTIPADSCNNCDAFDMKILSVTLTALSTNPEKTYSPSINNLPAFLFVFGAIFLIGLVVLLVTRVIPPKSGNRIGSEISKNDVEQSHHEEKGEDNASR